MDKYWNNMIYSICDGDIDKMRKIQKLDVFEFFDYIESKNG
jgi:hypothetical protein